MTETKPLTPDQLYQRCDPGQFSFNTTDELEDLAHVLGQDRVLEALDFGTGIQREGYNVYVLGPSGVGKFTTVRRYLEHAAQSRQRPPEWCYLHDFDRPNRPRKLRLPPGWGVRVRKHMDQLVEDLRTAIPLAFEAEEYRARVQELEEHFKERRETAFRELAEEAEKEGIALVRTPGGFAFAPVRDGEVLGPDEFDKLPEEERQRIEKQVSELQEKLSGIFRQMPQWQRDAREKIKELNREVAMSAVGQLIEDIKKTFSEIPELLDHLDRIQQDVIDNVDQFLNQEEGGLTAGHASAQQEAFVRRYKVNVLVDHSETRGAPVVYEDNPSYQNLIGTVEHTAQMGALVTDFTLIKPGALHRANGGYLVLDVRKLLLHPYAWEGLKRALSASEIRIESLGQIFSLVSTVSLEPDPIPLDVKVIVLGDRLLYYLLHAYDPEFANLFKVAADFDDQVDASSDNFELYGRLIATIGRSEDLLPFDRDAVARVIEHGSRLVEDAEKLSVHMRSVSDVLREADHWARTEGHRVVRRKDVQRAIDMQIRRADRIRSRIYEEIARDTILIDTAGAAIGQLNGLSVVSLGNFSFGQPVRITATARLGDGEVVDIEREVELGGSIHSKGVLILGSYLSSRYAINRPLSLKASLVFEQSYGEVEGDSASVAELCALLSVLAQISLRQDLAVTGSVNQHGQVQAIGGVNEKIEGFFDVCSSRGLNGDQGVLIPAANVKHLMLRDDVVAAVERGEFHIYPVTTIDQAIGLLTGTEAGERDQRGAFPEATVNGRVEARLEELADYRQEYIRAAKEASDHD